MLFFLAGTFCLTAVSSALRRKHKADSRKQLKALGYLFVYRPFHLFFFPKHEFEGLFFATICAQSVARFLFAGLSIFFLGSTSLYPLNVPLEASNDFLYFWLILSVVVLLLISFIFGDYLPRLFGTRFPETALRVCAPVCSIYMFLAFPIIFIFMQVAQLLSKTVYFDYLQEPEAQAKQEIIDMVQKAQLSPELDINDKKIIEAVFKFRDVIAREVMVPRVDLFSLSANTTIKEAAKLLGNEGYSRIPVYRDTVDNIVGVLMYKDILNKYREYEEKGNDASILALPIETILKNVFYTIETKKISHLLQEFKKKQVHLAIVVDEYGGTEGIVTIEDILEKIVGEIADEYDEPEILYVAQSDGSWIVDPRMNIMDAEEQLGLHIPEEGDYDSIAGYIFHCAGCIPTKGFVIHRDEFEIEILSSNERMVEKVKIKPLQNLKEHEF